MGVVEVVQGREAVGQVLPRFPRRFCFWIAYPLRLPFELAILGLLYCENLIYLELLVFVYDVWRRRWGELLVVEDGWVIRIQE